MSGVNRTYNLKVEVLTPTSIGIGSENDWQEGADYIEKDKKVYKLSLRKMVDAGIDIDKMTTCFMSKDSKEILNLIGNKLEEVSDEVFDCAISTTNPIKACIRNEFTDFPIIPGSSIKGSIRSVLLKALMKPEQKYELLQERATKVEHEVLGKATDGSDFMRFIKLSDVEFAQSELVNTKIFNLQKEGEEWIGGWKHDRNRTSGKYSSTGFNTVYEAIKTGSVGLGELMLADKTKELYDREQRSNPSKNIYLEVKNLFQAINQHTLEYLVKERAFFLKYTTERSEDVIDRINWLMDECKKSGSTSCVLKMSAGSGYHAITGDWQYSDFSDTGVHEWGKNEGKKKLKSRKLAMLDEKLMLMGFIRLTAVTNEEELKALQAEITETKAQKQRQQKQKQLERMAREEKAKAKEKERIAALKEQEANRAAYELLIGKARTEMENLERLIVEVNTIVSTPELERELPRHVKSLESLHSIQATLKEAAALCPNALLHTAAMEEIDYELVRIERQKSAIQARINECNDLERRKAEKVSAGLSFLQEKNDKGDFKVKDFKGASNRIAQWLKRSAASTTIPVSEWETLECALTRIFTQHLKEKERKEWLGEDSRVKITVLKWFEDPEKGAEMYQRIIKR